MSKPDRFHGQCQKPEWIVENIKILLEFKKENGGHSFNSRRISKKKKKGDDRNMTEKLCQKNNMTNYEYNFFYVVRTLHFGMKLYNDQRSTQGFN
jgi:hypothetical protein